MLKQFFRPRRSPEERPERSCSHMVFNTHPRRPSRSAMLKSAPRERMMVMRRRASLGSSGGGRQEFLEGGVPAPFFVRYGRPALAGSPWSWGGGRVFLLAAAWKDEAEGSWRYSEVLRASASLRVLVCVTFCDYSWCGSCFGSGGHRGVKFVANWPFCSYRARGSPVFHLPLPRYRGKLLTLYPTCTGIVQPAFPLCPLSQYSGNTDIPSTGS